MSENTLRLHIDSLTFATFKELWFIFQRNAVDFHRYHECLQTIVGIMSSHFSQELNTLRKFERNIKTNTAKQENALHLLQVAYTNVRKSERAVIEKKVSIKNMPQNIAFQAKKVLAELDVIPKKVIPHKKYSVLLNELYDSIRTNESQAYDFSFYKNLLAKKFKLFKPIFQKYVSYPDCTVYLKLYGKLISDQNKFLELSQDYLVYASEQPKISYTINEDAYTQLKSLSQHTLGHSEIVSLQNRIGFGLRSFHHTSRDYFIFFEIIWKFIFSLRSTDIFHKFINTPINQLLSNEVFNGSDYLLYGFLFLNSRHMTNYLLTALAGDDKTMHKDDILLRKMNMLKNSTEVRDSIDEYIVLLNYLRIYRSMTDELYNIKYDDKQAYLFFKKIFHTPIKNFSHFSKTLSEAEFWPVVNSSELYGSVYIAVITRILTQLDRIKRSFL